MDRRSFLKHIAAAAGTTATTQSQAQPRRSGRSAVPVIESEEAVYTFTPANNGAGPMWCSGSTCLVRIGGQLFASGLETIAGAAPLNNCRWTIYRRAKAGWRLWLADPVGRTREPAPLVGFPGGPLCLSANPTLGTGPQPNGGPAQPQILEFDLNKEPPAFRTRLPEWSGKPLFREHSYRSFAADSSNRELILFQNVDYSHAEWTFLDRTGRWSARGQLVWPWGADYETPQPIRVCYPNVALNKRSVHFCGVSDIMEPRQAWREFKRQLTGLGWDYDFRRLFYTWSPDVTTAGFQEWVELASREETGGRISPGDIWVAPDDTVHAVWTETAIDERLRRTFFPDARQAYSLRYAVLRNGAVLLRRTLAEAGEGPWYEAPRLARFHVVPPNRLFVVWHVSGIRRSGKPLSENRVVEVRNGELVNEPRRIPLTRPFISFFTATVRGGSPPSPVVEILGLQQGTESTVSYASVRLD